MGFIIEVNAAGIECAGSSEKTAINLETTNDFPCTNIEGSNITYTNNGKDLSQYFKLRSSKDRIDIIDTKVDDFKAQVNTRFKLMDTTSIRINPCT